MKRFHIEYFDPGDIALPLVVNVSCDSVDEAVEYSKNEFEGEVFDVLVRDYDTLEVLAFQEKRKKWLKGDEAVNKWADRIRSKGFEV